MAQQYLPVEQLINQVLHSKIFRSNWILIALTVFYQISLIYTIGSETGFDTGIVKWAAQSASIPDESYLQIYFSHNPNNLGLLFFERMVYHATKFFGLTNYTIVLDVINMIFVDIALILIGIILQKQLQRAMYWSLLPLILLISPWIVIAYTDTLVLPFIAGIILLGTNLFKLWQSGTKLNFNLAEQACLLGLVTWIAYRLKPSALIIVIAFLVELGLILLAKQVKLNQKNMVLTVVLFTVVFGGCQLVSQSAVKQQSFISINPELQELPSHYIMMGMSKGTTGSYSQADFLYSTKYTTKASQQKANLKRIRQRLDKFGVLGYLKFLVIKNYANTSDGTLGWLKEENFFSKNNLKKPQIARTN